MSDKYTAVWVSHSSISDYLKCPRLYYLRNMYKDPKTQHKITLMQPALALGQIVHETLDDISRLPAENRLDQSLTDRYLEKWSSLSQLQGIFLDTHEEELFKHKGLLMIQRVEQNPGPVLQKAIKIRQDLPHFFLSESEQIILCGKIDWLEYIPESDSVHIIDFKTGKYDEDPNSLQLPIYYLLVKNTQKRMVSKVSYWYLERDILPTSMQIPDESESLERVLEIAKKIALARKLEHLKCKQKDGCRFCIPYEEIINGKAQLLGANEFGQDIYVLPRMTSEYTSSESVSYPTDEPF